MTEAAAQLSHSAAYRVRFDEAAPDGLLRTSGLLRYAQDVGWRHSEALGLDRDWYAARGLAWVVRAAELEVLEAVPMGTELDVRTEVVGYQRIWARRRAECRLPDGRLAGWVNTDWVILDGRGRLARVPAEIHQRFPAPKLSDPLLRVPVPVPPADAALHAFVVRPHELDPMNHPNNAVYVDWLEETLLAAGGAAAELVTARPRRYRLEYAATAGAGSAVDAAAWAEGDGWVVRLVGPDDVVLLRSTIEAAGSPIR